MARFIRITHWSDLDNPITMFTTEDSLTVSAEDLVESMLGDPDTQVLFCTYSIEEEEGELDLERTAMRVQAWQGADFDTERNMAIAYYWYANAAQQTRAGGTIMSTKPAPLTREQMAWVLRCLAHNPNYHEQRVVVPLVDETVIEMVNGEVLPS